MTPRVNTNEQENTWLASAGEVERIKLSMIPGSLWQFSGFGLAPREDEGERWLAPPGLYRMIGIAKNVRTLQQEVVHIGVGGKDNGLLFCCPLGSWATHFTPAITTNTVAAPVEVQDVAAGPPLDGRGSGN
jgi:hypothetical protein